MIVTYIVEPTCSACLKRMELLSKPRKEVKPSLELVDFACATLDCVYMNRVISIKIERADSHAISY